MARNRHQEFLAFLHQLARRFPTQQVRLVLDNLQLLCGPCNRAKGAGADSGAQSASIAELKARQAWLEANSQRT